MAAHSSALPEPDIVHGTYNVSQEPSEATVSAAPTAHQGVSDRFVRGILGTQFPEDAQVVNWAAHGVQTFLPFVLEDLPPYRVRLLLCSKKYLALNLPQDLNAVRTLSRVPDAVEIQIVTMLKAPQPSLSMDSDIEFVNAIRSALREGTSVVMKGWGPDVLREF